jgi:hypothetical protein
MRFMQALQRGILPREAAKGRGIHHQQNPASPGGQIMLTAF